MVGNKRSWIFVGAVLAVALLAGASDAQATWWWNSCGYSCYTPYYYTSYYYYPTYSCCYYPTCYDSCCYGGWYVGYRYGPARGCLLGCGRYYYAGDYCCGYPVSYGYTVSGCCDGAVISAPATIEYQLPTPAKPAAPAAPPSTPAAPSPPATTTPPPPPAGMDGGATTPGSISPLSSRMPGAGASNGPTASTSGLLTIYVPADAKVIVNGYETKSTGSRRQYVSYGLRPGFSYKYEVKAQIVREGELVEESKTVVLTAGGQQRVAFGFNVPAESLASN